MTRKSRMLNRRVELWGVSSVPDGYGGNTITESKIKDLWARVEDVSFNNYDTIGQSKDLNQRRVITRDKNINTNENFFIIEGKKYQINSVQMNYKKTQSECNCEAV